MKNKLKRIKLKEEINMKSLVKIWLLVLGMIFAIGLVGFIGKVVLFPVHVLDKTAETGYGIVDKTLNADNVLFNYEQFHDLYQGAKQQAVNITNSKNQISTFKETYGEDASKYTKDVRNDLSFQQQNLEGYLLQYQKIVSEFNSNSQKLNRELFKSKELPYQLPLDYRELGI